MTNTTRINVGDSTQLLPVWSSANDSVATVDQTGLVTGVSPGTVEIYCTVNGLSAVTILTIEASAPIQSAIETETIDV